MNHDLTAQNVKQNDRGSTGVPGSVRRMQLRAKICEAVRPNACRFQRADPEHSKETDGWKTAEPKDGMICSRWWEMFHEPELNAFEGYPFVVVSFGGAAFILCAVPWQPPRHPWSSYSIGGKGVEYGVNTP